ncbi:hypothetical protein [Streptomyces sp. SAJ15]|uniref:hypothetical protein n=1 Tax=Streptomyces sp. SAJ15 TaxID=2011095 RepID=UPI001185306C|nr:hypothetical protein [Streptomyces sp. SAJ15]TVL89726.1 hypothetical protein CD790_25335 [Streptomyces sp. SAJ15]
MRTSTITAAILLAVLLPVSACSSGGDEDDKPRAKSSVDCTDQQLSQEEWIDNCRAASSAAQSSTGLRFGRSYRWPDGLEVSVVGARRVTDFGEYDRKPNADEIGFRVELKIANKGKAPAGLDDLSLIVEGATHGGQAASTTYDAGSEPLEGRIAPGVTVVKNDDSVLEKRYGPKIVVTVQRMSENFDLEFPEFTGSIE